MAKRWNGLCASGHGLDYEGQKCDVCAHEADPNLGPSNCPQARNCRVCYREARRVLPGAVGENRPMPVRPDQEGCDHDDKIVLKAVHDATGWRVQLHLHSDGKCAVLEGHARFTDQETCHAHGRHLHQALDVALGLAETPAAPRAQIGN